MATENAPAPKKQWLGQDPKHGSIQPGKEVKAYVPSGVTDGKKKAEGKSPFHVHISAKNLQAPAATPTK